MNRSISQLLLFALFLPLLCHATDFSRQFAQVDPSVVVLHTYSTSPVTEKVEQGLGSGVVISQEGDILTAAHVAHIEKDSNITLVKSDKSLKDGKKQRKPRIGRLNSALDVRREMARVYKKARHGEMDLTELNGYIKALSAMLVPIRDTELEERIKRLEGNG